MHVSDTPPSMPATTDNLATMPGFAKMNGVAVDSEGRADPQTQLFRSTAYGVQTGPFISQVWMAAMKAGGGGLRFGRLFSISSHHAERVQSEKSPELSEDDEEGQHLQHHPKYCFEGMCACKPDQASMCPCVLEKAIRARPNEQTNHRFFA